MNSSSPPSLTVPSPRSPGTNAPLRATPGSATSTTPNRARGERTPKPVNAAEEAFLAIGPGAAQWLMEAAAQGVTRIRFKMAEAVTLAKLRGDQAVDRALGNAAIAGRFAEHDLMAILDYQAAREGDTPSRAGETHSLQPGTSAWSRLGQ
jgi:hypothetical protein